MCIYSVYWIHLIEHTDVLSEGYVGVSINPKRRLSEHRLASKNQNNVNPYFERILAKHDVIQTIIFQGTEEECYHQEELLRPDRNIGWNINKGGSKPPSMKGIPRSNETKKKISNKLKGHVHSPETREKISKRNKERVISKETCEKISNSLIGKSRPIAVKEKISNSKKGKPGKSPSSETREKLSNAFKGRQFSEETRAKISEAKKEYWRIKKSLTD
jgi:hypothetical protein